MRRKFKVLLEQAGSFELMPVGGMADRILFQDYTLELFAEAIAVEQVAHADSAARHFIFVSGTDTARRGADFRRAARLLGRFVHFAMIGKDQMGAVAEKEPPAHFNAGFFQIFEFCNERSGIDNGAGSDHSFFPRSKYSARDQLENVAVAVEDDGVSRIMAACVTRDVIERRGDIVYNLAFAFIAPLRTDYHHCFSRRLVHLSGPLAPFKPHNP